ncbi:MAG TPA: hypothetical protein VNQ90_18950 [Chthoniobacteraceae bacterium]|nr:hypothetical protein [Chthoniobacteraceae bacterium]
MRIALILVLALFSSSCATGRKEAQTPPPQPAEVHHQLVGIISTVNRDHGFVLIHSNDLRPAGSALMTLPAHEGTPQAHLRVSREQRPPFLIADILDGEPLPGETVVDAPASPRPATGEVLSTGIAPPSEL